MNYKKGFTLAEVLTAVALVSIIGAVVLGSLNEGRAKARDAARIESLHTIKEALRAYHVTYGKYPLGNTSDAYLYCDSSTSCFGETSRNNTFLQELINKGFMAGDIQDPLNTTKGDIGYYLGYAVNTEKDAFILGVPLETNKTRMLGSDDYGPCDDMYETFLVHESTDLHADENIVGDPDIFCRETIDVVEPPVSPGCLPGLPGC